MNKKVRLTLLILFLVSFSVSTGASKLIERNGQIVYVYDYAGKVIKTINLKTKKVDYVNKNREYLEVIHDQSTGYEFFSGTNYNQYVNALISKEYWYGINGKSKELTAFTTYQYNDLGLLESVRCDESEDLIRKYYYTKNGLVIRKECYGENQILTRYDEYLYDDLGQRIKMVFPNNKFGEIVFSYKNNLLSEFSINSTGFGGRSTYKFYYNAKKELIRFEYSDDFPSFNESYFDHALLKKQKNELLLERFDQKNKKYAYVQYIYNTRGLLVEIKNYTENKLTEKKKFDYDNQGRMIKRQEYLVSDGKETLADEMVYEYE